jgi:hypothetical protein
MKTILQLLLLALLGYLIWVYGVPWVRRQAGQTGPPVSGLARGPGGSCVQAAALAAEGLHDRLLDHTRALMDDEAWGELVGEVETAMGDARVACTCKLESCATARQAIASLDWVFTAARDQMRSSQSVPLELGRRYEQANQQLWEAYDLARDGR